MLVKITILVLVVTLIYNNLVKNYLENSPLEVIKLNHTDYCPAYIVIRGLLSLASIVLAIVCVVYLLFFRL